MKFVSALEHVGAQITLDGRNLLDVRTVSQDDGQTIVSLRDRSGSTFWAMLAPWLAESFHQTYRAALRAA